MAQPAMECFSNSGSGELPICICPPNGAADQRRGGGELAHQPNRPLHPLDGRREAPDRQRMAIRSADGAARSVRAIDRDEPPSEARSAPFRRLGSPHRLKRRAG